MTVLPLALAAMLAALIPPDWSLAKAHAEKRGLRERVSLNGYWRFIPCEAETKDVPAEDAGWGWFLVPGERRACGYGNFMHGDDGKVQRKFKEKAVEKYPAGFYRRTFDPPASMKGREVRLYFDLIFTDVKIWINGREVPVPRTSLRRFHVPIGEHLVFGRANDIVMRVAAEEGRYSGRACMRSDVWLEARPKVHFGEPAVETSLSKRQIQVRFLGGGLKDGAGTLTRRIVDAKDGKEVYADKVPFATTSTIPFVTPKLWSPDSPSLYRLELSLAGADGKTIDAAAVRFGFRELRISGGDYLLNGKRIEMFCDSSWPSNWTHQWHIADDYARKCLRTLKTMNVTSVYGHPHLLPESFFDLADEEGFMILYALNGTGLSIHKTPFSEYLPVFEAHAREEAESRSFINHPCNVALLDDIWYNYHNGTRNPAFVGMRDDGRDPNLKLKQPSERAANLRTLVAATGKIFPGYEVFTGADGHCGNLYSTHLYHTWGVPTAEMAAFFSRYSEERALPIFAGEVNIQYPCAFGDLRQCPSAPLYTENAARLMGPEAYRLERVNTGFFCTGPDNDFLQSTSDTDPLDHRIYAFVSDIYARTLEDYVERMLFNWRFDGANGFGFFEHVITARYLLSARSFSNISEVKGDLTRPGTKSEQLWGTHHRPPFEHLGDELLLRPGIVAAPFLRATDPVAVDFAGAGSDRYERDHAWFGGERLVKAIAIANRTETPRTFEARIRLTTTDGSVLSDRTAKVSVGAWTNRLSRFTIDLPRVTVRTEALLKADLASADGGKPLSCSLAVEIFPRPDVAANGGVSVALHGADAAFAEKVRALGFKVDAQSSLAVFAAGTMSDPAMREKAERLAATGNVLILEQPVETSHELVKVRQRRAFIQAAGHPALAEFRDADFAYWRGSAASVPSVGERKANMQWTDWGSRNMVAANVFRRPAHGNFLSLLVCGFDLFESPLLERRDGKGTLVMSQLEISARLGEDPVATRLFCNLLHYLDGRRAAARRVGVIAGKEGKAYLAKLGVKAEEASLDEGKDFSAYDVLVVSSPDWQAVRRRAMAFADFVHGGGKVVYLHAGGTFSSTWLPFALEHGTRVKTDGAAIGGAADSTWLNGWGASELYWHGQVEIPVFTKVPKSAEASDPQLVVRRKTGTGEFILVSASPDDFPKDASRGKIDRLVSSILTSVGVPLGDVRGFPYQENRYFIHDLTQGQWSFAEDPGNVGLDEKWQAGGGRPKWVTGQMTGGGEYVKAGIPWKNFLEKPYKGIGWYKIEFSMTEKEVAEAEKDSHYFAYTVGGADRTWINGRHVGAYAKVGAHRYYRIPSGTFKVGTNVLTVRLEEGSGEGGLLGTVQIKIGSGSLRYWSAPWPEGTDRDYGYPCDMIRMY